MEAVADNSAVMSRELSTNLTAHLRRRLRGS
jgi:hypothetical protein